MSQRLRRTQALGKIPYSPPPEYVEKMRRALQHRRPPVEAVLKALATYLPKERKPKVWTAHERMEEYLRRIATGRTTREVSRDEDMPSLQSFYRHCGENPAFLRRFEVIWDKLPFAVQIRGHRTGPRYRKAVIALRNKRKTWAEIGRIMGVREKTVCSSLHRWQKSDR
jgi:hypothetical protein